MARAAELLKEYRAKRNFRVTAEPEGTPKGRARKSARASFVVQQHHATRPHYDFRLEIDGVLKSWAVPKGPSMDPADRRLAVEVEDHPLDYGGFEGTIPKGQYGGGSVLLWDRGTWELEEGDDPARAHRDGKIKFVMKGKKLKGGFTLVRMRGRAAGGDGKNNWLLLKERDDFARPGYDVTASQRRSVASNRVIEEIGEKDRVWQSDRPASDPAPEKKDVTWLRGSARDPVDPGKKKRAARTRTGGATPRVRSRKRSTPAPASRPAPKRLRDGSPNRPARLAGARRAPMPDAVEPELCTLRDHTPEGPEWMHEVKFDGYRVLAFIDRGRVRLITRHGKDWTARFPTVAAALKARGFRSGVLDGEVVVLNDRGLSDFRLVQNAMQEGNPGRMMYFVFDVVHWGGFDVRPCELRTRRAFLSQILGPDSEDAVRLSQTITGHGEDVIRHACRLGLEGIVSKRLASAYVGARTPAWVKVKCSNRQEMVIGGYTEPRKSRQGFGALLLGYYNEQGELVYAGKVGTGFDHALLKDIQRRLSPMEREAPQFVNPPRGAEAAGAHWVNARLVAEIEFTEWTGDGRLRHPVFVGLREDKSAAEVVRETSGERQSRADLQRPSGRGRKGVTAESATRTSPGRTSARRAALVAKAGSPGAVRAKSASEVRVLGVPVSHPERVVFEDEGLTKADVARHYQTVAPWIMPHAQNRPLSIFRCPDGAGKQCFFQKHPTVESAPGIEMVEIRESKGPRRYAAVVAPPGLVSLAQMNALELHGWGSRSDNVERPDRLVMDLDPGEGVAWDQIVEAAEVVRASLRGLGLESFLKTTGGKGLHVVAPIRRTIGWDDLKAWTRALAERLASQKPAVFVANMSKALRRGKIFIDYLRNQRGGTSVLPYSTRARPGATVSMPIEWDQASRVKPGDFTVRSVGGHLERRRKDPWRHFAQVRQSVPRA